VIQFAFEDARKVPESESCERDTLPQVGVAAEPIESRDSESRNNGA